MLHVIPTTQPGMTPEEHRELYMQEQVAALPQHPRGLLEPIISNHAIPHWMRFKFVRNIPFALKLIELGLNASDDLSGVEPDHLKDLESHIDKLELLTNSTSITLSNLLGIKPLLMEKILVNSERIIELIDEMDILVEQILDMAQNHSDELWAGFHTSASEQAESILQHTSAASLTM